MVLPNRQIAHSFFGFAATDLSGGRSAGPVSRFTHSLIGAVLLVLLTLFAVVANAATAVALAALLVRVRDGTVSGTMGKQVFEAMWLGEGSADAIIDARGLRQLNDDSALIALIDEVMAESPAQVEQYRAGKDKVFGFFVGQVMKRSQGKANPQALNTLLKDKLGPP